MIAAYIFPLLMIAAFFVAVLFLMNGMAKLILYALIVSLLFIPFILLYKAEEDKEKK